MVFSVLNREELKRRVLNKKGNLNLDATLKDFAEYMGFRVHKNDEGLSHATYSRLRKFDDMTIEDLGRIRPYGLKRLRIIGIGEKNAGEINKFLSKYGVEPIPWVAKKYRAYELKKELQKDYGPNVDDVWDVIRKN